MAMCTLGTIQDKRELRQRQRYAIATMLATDVLDRVERRLREAIAGGWAEPWSIEFAREIDKHYGRRNGFVPRVVRAIVNRG